MGIGPETVGKWKENIREKQYKVFVDESTMIARLFHNEKDENWIGGFQKLHDFLEDLGDRQILPNVKKYLMDFIEAEIKCIRGEMTKNKLMKEKKKAIDLISKAHTS